MEWHQQWNLSRKHTIKKLIKTILQLLSFKGPFAPCSVLSLIKAPDKSTEAGACWFCEGRKEAQQAADLDSAPASPWVSSTAWIKDPGSASSLLLLGIASV